MKTFKYKGLSEDTGELIFGFLSINLQNDHCLYEPMNNKHHYVKKETVRLLTGLFDKNGSEIAVDDKVEYKLTKYTVCFGQFETNKDEYQMAHSPIGFYVKSDNGGTSCLIQENNDELYIVPANECLIIKKRTIEKEDAFLFVKETIIDFIKNNLKDVARITGFEPREIIYLIKTNSRTPMNFIYRLLYEWGWCFKELGTAFLHSYDLNTEIWTYIYLIENKYIKIRIKDGHHIECTFIEEPENLVPLYTNKK